MFKRLFNLSSPIGIAITAVGVILALSPQARRATRQLLVKSTSMMLGTVESIKATAGVTVNMADTPHMLADQSPAECAEVNDVAAETKDAARLNIGGMLGDAAGTIIDGAGKMGHKVQAGLGGIIDSVTGDRHPETH